MTEDKDFGELVFRMQWQIPGVLLLRMPAAPWQVHWGRLRFVLENHATRLVGAFTVIEEERLRFSTMP